LIKEINKILDDGKLLSCIDNYKYNCCCNTEFCNIPGNTNDIIFPGEKEILQNNPYLTITAHDGIESFTCSQLGKNCEQVKPIYCKIFPFYPLDYYSNECTMLAALHTCPIYYVFESEDVKSHLKKVFKAGLIIKKHFPNYLKLANKVLGIHERHPIAYNDLKYKDIDILKRNYKNAYMDYHVMTVFKYFDSLNVYINSKGLINFHKDIEFINNVTMNNVIGLTNKFPTSNCYMIDKVELFSRDELLSLLKKVFEYTEYIVCYSNSNLLDMIPYKILVKDGFYIIVNELPEVSKYFSFIDWKENLKFKDTLPYNNTFSTEKVNNDLIITNATEEDLTYLKHVIYPLKFNNVVAKGFYKYIFGWKNEINGNLTMEK
jgi:hypothetical protein